MALPPYAGWAARARSTWRIPRARRVTTPAGSHTILLAAVDSEHLFDEARGSSLRDGLAAS